MAGMIVHGGDYGWVVVVAVVEWLSVYGGCCE